MDCLTVIMLLSQHRDERSRLEMQGWDTSGMYLLKLYLIFVTKSLTDERKSDSERKEGLKLVQYILVPNVVLDRVCCHNPVLDGPCLLQCMNEETEAERVHNWLRSGIGGEPLASSGSAASCGCAGESMAGQRQGGGPPGSSGNAASCGCAGESSWSSLEEAQAGPMGWPQPLLAALWGCDY